VRISSKVGLLVLICLAAGCARRELVLEGERIGVRDALLESTAPDATEGEGSAEDQAAAPVVQNQALPITLPAPQSNTDWTQVGGNSQHFIANPALGSALSQVWSVNIGAGDSRKFRISASPVVADGRVITLDAQSGVMAHSTGGAALWSADLTPPSDKSKDASGGGLAYGDGMVFVTTGFGALVALDAASGDTLWVQDTDSAVVGAPAYRDGVVYVVGRDNRAWAVNADDGRVRWQLPGTPSVSGMLGGAAPAFSDRAVIFPFASSELVAALPKSGIRVWGAAISGERRGRVYTTVTDITGDPVVANGTVYVGTQSGRTAAVSSASGTRIWTADEGAYSPVVPIGGSVFLVSDQAELLRLDGETGDRIWGIELPYFTKEKPKRRKAVFAHYGPVLAGGRLIVASDDGVIRQFSPEDGSLIGEIALRGGAAADPVVAGGTLYVISTGGQLHAFR